MQRSAFLPAPANDTQSLAGCMQPTQAGEQTERENTLKGSWVGGWVHSYSCVILSIPVREVNGGRELSPRFPLRDLHLPLSLCTTDCSMTLSDSVSHFSQFL